MVFSVDSWPNSKQSAKNIIVLKMYIDIFKWFIGFVIEFKKTEITLFCFFLIKVNKYIVNNNNILILMDY